ncbi:MAG TPA: (Fe-S)-binding protein, partial [Desulfopila sp.]|nr:(Fe-S)-binding protein [Desulfopila sp.]
RKAVVEWGGKAQRLGVKMLEMTPATLKGSHNRMVEMLRSPMVPPSSQTLRHILPSCSNSEALLIRPPKAAMKTVFYFPGCGSERLYGDIAKAGLYILLKNNLQIVLPPPYLCCGFPAQVNAKKKMHNEIVLRDTIIFSQIRDMLGHISFDAVLVSCGTCREALHRIGCDEIFGCGIEDISSYALGSNATMFTALRGHYLYHAPCHDSLAGSGRAVIEKLGATVSTTPNCCSEAGTLAISRPDISSAMRGKKRRSIGDALSSETKRRTVLTNCPSCISGLGRNTDMNIAPQHLAETLAVTAGGSGWREELDGLLQGAEKVTF